MENQVIQCDETYLRMERQTNEKIFQIRAIDNSLENLRATESITLYNSDTYMKLLDEEIALIQTKQELLRKWAEEEK